MSQHDVSNPAATSSDDPLVGTLVAGRYRIARKVGEGGMGTVYQAVHEALRKQVALKLLSGRGSSDKEMVARFEREAIAAANLRHPNIAEATDFGRLPNGEFYLVMEYVEGKTLRALLRASPAGLETARALVILRQVASALARAHAKEIVHRDLKPENVIVFDRRDAKDAVKVIDFGIAHVRDAFGAGHTALTAAGMVFGTPEYMAPEQVLGKPVDGRTDQYAFGVMAFELLTGRVPFTGEELGQILMKHVNAPIPSARDTTPHLPPAAASALETMLAKRPGDRFATIEQACQALQAALDIPATSAGTVLIDSRASVPTPMTPPAGTVSVKGRGPADTPAPPVAAITSAQPVSGTTETDAAAKPTSPAARVTARLEPLLETVKAFFRDRPLLETVKDFFRDKSKNPVFLFGGLTVGAILVLMVLTAVVWRAAASSLPDEADDAIGEWEDGAYEKAESGLRTGLLKKPSIATDPDLYEPLIATVHEEKARSVLSSLMSDTALGRSAPMAAALADLGLEDASPTRNGALKLLRGRLDLLPKEQRARIALRDADDCASLQQAVSDLAGAGSDAEDDAKRFREGECHELLRRDELCGCPLSSSSKGRKKKGGGR
jgi:serine/threonine protein kinase